MLERLAVAAGDKEQAQQLQAEAVQVLGKLGDISFASGWPGVGVYIAPLVQGIMRERIGALQAPLSPSSGATGFDRPQAGYPDDLTRREVEVLRLLADGPTDADIADKLFLSTRTVQAHVRSIYSKLNVTNRSAATRYAVSRKLV